MTDAGAWSMVVSLYFGTLFLACKRTQRSAHLQMTLLELMWFLALLIFHPPCKPWTRILMRAWVDFTWAKTMTKKSFWSALWAKGPSWQCSAFTTDTYKFVAAAKECANTWAVSFTILEPHPLKSPIALLWPSEIGQSCASFGSRAGLLHLNGGWSSWLWWCLLLYSGIETLQTHDGDNVRLGRVLAALARKFCQGRACLKPHEDAHGHHRSLSNSAVFELLQIFPPAWERRARRLLWWQSIARHPGDNVSLLATVFGQYGWENGPPIGVDGRVTALANPWLRELVEDLDKLGEPNLVADQPLSIFFHPCKDLFVNLPIRTLLVRKYREELAALGLAPVENADEVAPVGPAPLRCDWIGADGAQCGYTAQSTTALSTHRHRLHGVRITARQIVVCNQCPWCRRIFASVEIAKRHAHARVKKKGTALDKGGMLLAWWSNCVPLQLFDVQSVLMKQLIWKPCRHMWWATSPLANMFCTSTSLRLSSSWKVETEPSAMDSWFGAAPNGAGAERQVRPRTGRSSKDNEQLLTAVARLTLKNAQVCRNLESAVFVTYILAKEGAYAQAASAAGQTYAQRARAAGKNHTLGQPSSWVWAALTQAALKDEALSEEKRAMVKQHCDSVTDPAVLSDQVLYCRVSKVYDQTKVRLQISVAPGALSDVLTVLQDGMEKSGGLRKDGPAPRGALERQIQEIIGEPGVE